MSILISNLQVFKECTIKPWHPRLQDVVCFIGKIINHPTITCGYQPRNYPSIHNTYPLRAVDIRSRNLNYPCLIEEIINDYWIYDPLRPNMTVCYWHPNENVNSANKEDCHFHIQVHDNTRKRGD